MRVLASAAWPRYALAVVWGAKQPPGPEAMPGKFLRTFLGGRHRDVPERHGSAGSASGLDSPGLRDLLLGAGAGELYVCVKKAQARVGFDMDSEK